ncbi:unnamed protein product [Miscanthus lutarioriparius]|uniref:3-hydroxyisobutyryl-CoA hydrolase n=1 Tax=Miscanthus lutarioriparius TaxID=422564 RepID=A0A811QHX2_9POAL|nr:unnamed protein product [Miscanthus lutarioriparius]
MASLPATGGAAGGDSDQVLVEAHGSTRTLILNRPNQLNVLSSAMIKGLLRCFIVFEKDDRVKLLIMKGKGRAFCAGGDVTECVRSIHNESWKWGADFFRDLYLLNYMSATYIKPQVFAMPETALGSLPGEYVALAGARLDGAEMLACGLATHFVQSNRLPLLQESLKKLDTSNTFAVCSTIDHFAQQPSLKENSSLNRLEIINKCFSKSTVEEIISTLEQVASNLADEWVARTIQYLKKASPTSLKITLRSIREGRTQTVGECLHREYRVICHLIRGDFSRDFYEGCRAILLDKDRRPKWMPPNLEQVHEEVVEEYFSRIDDPQWEDLNLPDRRSHGRIIESKI